MPVPDFVGETFVAFADISGFKELMKRDQSAVATLDNFYQLGFRVLRNNQSVHGFFVSDCAILFVNNHNCPHIQLQFLLGVVEQLNRQLLEHDVMLSTSIAYGRFSYHQRIEFEGIEKNPIYGNAYVSVFLDNESASPRIQPGECRIIKRGLENYIEQFNPSNSRLRDKGKYLYYYWMVNDESGINQFIARYADAYQQKYRGMLEAIKGAINNQG